MSDLSNRAMSSTAARVLVIVWSIVGTFMVPPTLWLGKAGLGVLTEMHESIERINVTLGGYEELRKQREVTLAQIRAKDEEHDRALYDHERRLSMLEGKASRAR